MKVEVDTKGNIQIDLRELVDSMSDDAKAEFARHLVADELLFQAVADYIVTGQYHDGWWMGGGAQKLRERFLPLMPDAARNLVRDLVHERDRLAADLKNERDDYWALYHAWPDTLWQLRPARSKWEPVGTLSPEQAQAMIDERAASPSPAPEGDEDG